MLGAWAEKHLPAMADADLPAYEAILNRETLDIYNLITGATPPPPELQGAVLDSIRRFVDSSPLGKASVKVCARRGRGPRRPGPDGAAAVAAAAQGGELRHHSATDLTSRRHCLMSAPSHRPSPESGLRRR